MLSDWIDRALAEEEDREPSGKLAPSYLYGCERRAILRQRKTPPTVFPDARTRRVFTMGDIVEKFVLDTLEMKGLIVGRAVPVGNDLWQGLIDAIVKENGLTFILEVKSVHSKAFWHSAKEARNGYLSLGQGMPYDSHIYQASAYHLLRGDPDLANPHILYISKDDLAMEEFVLGRQQGLIVAWRMVPGAGDVGILTKRIPDELSERMARLEYYVTKGEIPPIPFARPDEHPFLCQKQKEPSCPYYHYCWGGKNLEL